MAKTLAQRIATSALADQIANSLTTPLHGEALRDFCDSRTGGELDGFALDLLTDMVGIRLRRRVVLAQPRA